MNLALGCISYLLTNKPFQISLYTYRSVGTVFQVVHVVVFKEKREEIGDVVLNIEGFNHFKFSCKARW